MIEEFKQWYDDRHSYAKEWKKNNRDGKVVGYFCTYVPEEILYAVNCLPVRIIGGHEPPALATPHMFDMWCPFSRDCLSQGLAGYYDYLDGIIIAQCCLHIRQAFGAWQLQVPTPWSYYVCMPNAVTTSHAKKFLLGELAEFKIAVESWVGKKVTDADLDRGIDIMNTSRRLMKKVYEFRKEDYPLLTGTEAMTMVWASQLMDKREHNVLVEELLRGLPNRELDREPGIRLMIVGSENDDRPFMEMVESIGATFVIDDHCTGSRYFWDEISTNPDRLQAIADRYCDRVPCPTKDFQQETWERKRFPHILTLAKEYRVQGVILVQQKFCDPHECDIPSLKRYLEGNGIPCYVLEFEVTVPVGQFRIRIEAFIEQLRADELFD
jgi:benzoyl-CoA reductase subunit C